MNLQIEIQKKLIFNPMKKILSISILMIFFLPNLTGFNFTRGAEPEGKKFENSVIHLFNGNDLNGWYTFLKGKGKNIDPNKVFTVQNGLIRISGEEFGCITTNNEYTNYKLEIEYKWGELTYPPRVSNARDSGVLLHSTGEDGGSSGTWMHSIECQLIEGGTGDLLVVGDGTAMFSITCPVAPEKQGDSYVFKEGGNPATINGGRINWFGRDSGWKDMKGFRGAKDVEKPIGEWNKLMVFARGKEITIYLNGTLVNHAIDVQPQKGRIQVQSEGAEIFLKRVDLIPIN
jgi:hypothetical protein